MAEKKTVTFYYVRHGTTLFNRLGRMQGRCDAPLEKEGIAQAYEAREELKDIDFDRAYTSTSERCIDTAHIVLQGRDVPLIYTKDLKEMSEDVFQFKEATLYPVHHKMEADGYVKSYRKEADNGKLRTYYKITGLGEEQLASEKKKWNEYARGVARVAGGTAYAL